MNLLARTWVSPRGLQQFHQAIDEFGESSGPSVALIAGVALAVVVVVLILVVLKSWEKLRGRARQIRASAESEGFDFVEQNLRNLTQFRFDSFMEATGFFSTSIVTTKGASGHRLYAFDYELINEYEIYQTPDGKRHRRKRGEANTIGGAAIGREVEQLGVVGCAAMTTISSFLRNVVVQPQNWHISNASRLPLDRVLTNPPPDFAAVYNVRSDDPEFANRLVNEGIISFLMSSGGRFGLEIRGNQVMLLAKEVKPANMCDFARLVEICVDHISPDLLDDYPEVVGVDSGGAPRLAPRDSDPAAGRTFPSIEHHGDASSPVLPATLSSRPPVAVPIVASDPTGQSLPPVEPSTESPQPPASPGMAPSNGSEVTQPVNKPAQQEPESPAQSVDWSL